jgi:hypothetical protein
MVNSLGQSVQDMAQRRNNFFAYQFMNDASYTQNPLSSYGPVNLAKLRDISAAYDPEGIFQTLQNSGFLLSRA